jgi:hypothetical protein
VLSILKTKVVPERLAKVIAQTVEVLAKKGKIKVDALALDSTYIKAFSRRYSDNRTGYSDPESGIGRAVLAKDLGCSFTWLLMLRESCQSPSLFFLPKKRKIPLGLLRKYLSISRSVNMVS